MPIATNTSIQIEFFILNCKVTNIYQLLTIRCGVPADFWFWSPHLTRAWLVELKVVVTRRGLLWCHQNCSEYGILRHSCNKCYHPASRHPHLHLSLNQQTFECRMFHCAILPMMPSASLMESQYRVTSSNSLKTTPTWTSTMPSVSSRKSKKPSRKFVKGLRCTKLSNSKLSRQCRILRPRLSAYSIHNAISVDSVNLPL